MPILVVLIAIVAVYSCTLPGAIDGIKYYIDDEGTNHSAPESQEWVF